MGVIFMPNNLICQMQQSELIIILIINFHTGNVYCDAVLTVHVSIFLTKKQLKSMKKLHPLLGFTFITSLEVVLLMVEFHWKTRTYGTCLNKKLYQINIQKYTPEKNWLWWRQPYQIFIQVSIYQPSKSWPFIYHMYAYLVQITVVNCDAQPSNDVNYFKMYYVAVIMQKGQFMDGWYVESCMKTRYGCLHHNEFISGVYFCRFTWWRFLFTHGTNDLVIRRSSDLLNRS